MDKNITSMNIRDPGLRSLPPGVERYLVKGGGLSVISLNPDDKIDVQCTSAHNRANQRTHASFGLQNHPGDNQWSLQSHIRSHLPVLAVLSKIA